MERDKPKKGGAFNTEEILDLLSRFESSTLSEMQVRQWEIEIVFRRGTAAPPPQGMPEPLPQAAAPPPPQVSAVVPGAPASDGKGLERVVSPIVGTFYRAPAPDAPAFVERGSRVRKGQTLCVLEAMKLMNQLEAEFDCEIVSVLVESGKMVEFGTPLFEVRRT